MVCGKNHRCRCLLGCISIQCRLFFIIEVDMNVYYNVYIEVYMRTNIVLNDELVRLAFMCVPFIKTKKDLIEAALREFVEVRKTKEIQVLWGNSQKHRKFCTENRFRPPGFLFCIFLRLFDISDSFSTFYDSFFIFTEHQQNNHYYYSFVILAFHSCILTTILYTL